jgi:PAS domain S-box-containing protein
MSKNLKILHLEDSAIDAELIRRELKKGNVLFETKVVETKDDFVKALSEFSPDIILSDHSLPSFNSLDALKIVREKGMKTPFILLTATVSEEFAADIMKEGADDYILKDRSQRLPSAVLKAVEKYESENDREKFLEEIIANEALMKEAERLAHFGSWQNDPVQGTVKWSDETYRILGYKPGEVEPCNENFFENIHPEDKPHVKEVIESSNFDSKKMQFRVMVGKNSLKYVASELVIHRNKNKKLTRVIGFIQDVTEAKEAEESLKKLTDELIHHNKNLEQFAYIVSHNLRAPVANIMGISNALQNIKLSEEEEDVMTQGLYTSVEKLDEVIKDLNNILQVKQEISEKKEPVHFSEILSDIRNSIDSLIEKEAVEIRCDFSEADEIITLKSYIYSVFFNLISNSIKYRQPEVKPLIEIKSRKLKNKIELLFNDNGMGIDLKKKGDQVFGLYKRFHTHAEGKGLGLFMTKIQVETLGGKISIKSELNKGTEFKIELDI